MTAITEADRTTAANVVQAYRGEKNDNWQQRIRDGKCDVGTIVQAFSRHRLTATVEARKELIAQGCIHTRKAADQDGNGDRADIAQWQADNKQWFDATICEIVSEYADWRDTQPPDPTTAANTLRDAKLITPEQYNRICANIRAKAVFRGEGV